MADTLTSRRYTLDDAGDAIEFCHQKGWTDGLPVIPPTPDRVHAMLDAVGLDPKHEVATIAHRAVTITAEKAAINAVLAGCKPERATRINALESTFLSLATGTSDLLPQTKDQ